MLKAVVFGATDEAKLINEAIEAKYDVIAYCDNNKNKWGKTLHNRKIHSPAEIVNMEYDMIVINSMSIDEISRQLVGLGVQESKIDCSFVELPVRARVQFLRNYAELVYQNNIEGSVAEAGVFQGEFAKIINESFSDRKLYLFDTFEGFDARDIAYEKEQNFSNECPGALNMTSVELVLDKMEYPDNCIVRKGFFPDTTEGIDDKFCFVNLDMDLYKPTWEGVKFFYPRMVQRGIILIHDYFTDGYKGVRRAVEEFIEKFGVVAFPIGDGISIAIQKH